MDDLWGPPSYYQDPEDTDSFRFPYDVKDDSAINEKCCIQVLNILISKQDTDISELEDELMDLLNQLACCDVEFSDMVSMSLGVHVEYLDSSVTKLKDGVGDFSLTSRQPADSINDIMKSLFSSYLRKKAQQVPAVNPSEKKEQTSSSSKANQLEKSKRVDIKRIPQSSRQAPTVNPSENREQTSSSSNVNQLEKSKKVVIKRIPQSSYLVPAVNRSESREETSSSSNANQVEKSKIVVIKRIPQNSYPVPAVNPSENREQTSSSSNANELKKSQIVVIKRIPQSSCQVPAVSPPEKKEQTSSSNANQVGKNKRVVINTIPLTRVKTEEDNSIYPCMSPMSKYSAQGPFRFSLEKMNKCQEKPPIIMTKNILQNNTPRCKSICQKRSLETQGKLKMVKTQPDDDETIGSLSIFAVETSQEPAEKQMQNTTRDLVLFNGESNPGNQHHQQPRVSLSVKKTFKKDLILNSQLMKSSKSSPPQLEPPKKKYAIKYTVPKLRAIARERNLSGYSKFRKVELAELLGIDLTEGRKPKKEVENEEETASSKDTGWAIAIAS